MPLILSGDNGVDKVQNGSIQFDDVSAGMVIQVANYTTGAMATGTATIPLDNTIPQITEGTQFMSLAFTPKKANSKLKIEVTSIAVCSTGQNIVIALFRDSGANAIATIFDNRIFGVNAGGANSFTVFVDANSISSTTFTVRIGMASAATITFNGIAATAYLGGSLASSITITEIAQ
jgi:hypothetical protein